MGAPTILSAPMPDNRAHCMAIVHNECRLTRRGRRMDGIVERVAAFALVGLASGFVSGLFGVGGGIVRIPIFVYLLPLFGVAHPVMMHVAVGTSVALVIPSAIARPASSSLSAISI